MLLDLFLIGAMTAATVSALPADATSSAPISTYTATFSENTHTCGITECPPPGYPYYDALYYKSINVEFQRETGSGNCALICAHDSEFYGHINPQTTGYEIPIRSITANYAGSKVNFFNFKSFYAGCVAPVRVNNFDYPYPAPCNITVKGYSGLTDPTSNTPAIATQRFTYTPTIRNNPQGIQYAPMSQFTLSPLFSTVRTVTFSATTGPNIPAAQGYNYTGQPDLYIDTLVYTVFNRTL